jgi:hypothetical protein
MAEPATLGVLREQGTDVFVSCVRCNRYESLSVASLIERLGETYPVSAVGHRLNCNMCGGLFIETRPAPA